MGKLTQVSATAVQPGKRLAASVVPSAVSKFYALDDNSQKALLYCTLLAIQFGLQPMIAAKFTPPGVSKSSIVIATELTKIAIAVVAVLSGPATELESIKANWTLQDSFKVAALPATLYAIQNLLIQYGYVYLDNMSFNLLNQTKVGENKSELRIALLAIILGHSDTFITLSAALWLYLLLGQAQSGIQMVALGMLLVAAVLLNLPDEAVNKAVPADGGSFGIGVALVATASMLSGLSASLTQRALVGAKPRPSLFFSAELAVYGIIFLLANLFFNSDVQGSSLFSYWTAATFIPVVSNALGGLVVGQVTKYAGGVVKGFALIAGIVITGLAQWVVDGKPLRSRDAVAVLLVSVSIFLHSKYPPSRKVDPAAKKTD